MDGLTVNVDRIEFKEARLYVNECLSLKKCANVDSP